MNADKTKLLVVIALSLVACNLGQTVATLATPTLPPTATPPPSVTRLPSPVALPPPAWWDAKIGMPPGAEFAGDVKRAVWRTRDVNVDGIRDFFLRQASNLGYQTYVITQSQGAIYDLLFVKAQTAFALNLTLGSDTTVITAQPVGVMRLKVSGVANLEIDLPMRGRIDSTPGSEVSIGTSIPNPKCAGCQYFINVHIAPFKGAGNYDSKPGISIIDVELVPGGDYDQDNYRWAQNCVVTVNPNSGNFDCRGLQNINDQSRKVDASGSWQQPAD